MGDEGGLFDRLRDAVTGDRRGDDEGRRYRDEGDDEGRRYRDGDEGDDEGRRRYRDEGDEGGDEDED